ncbi:MAG: hypothetical protein AAGG51_07055 [Cyanobacteria bacterium P01_G01_bin.54]
MKIRTRVGDRVPATFAFLSGCASLINCPQKSAGLGGEQQDVLQGRKENWRSPNPLKIGD